MRQRNPSRTFIGWLFCCSLVDAIAAHNILFLSVFGSRSHMNVLDPVAEELGKRGHQVVFITSVSGRSKIANVTHVVVPETETLMYDDSINFFTGDLTSSNYTESVKELIYKLTKVTLAHPLAQDIINNPGGDSLGRRPKFDLLVLDTCFNQFGLVLSHRMAVPTVYFTTTMLAPNVAWSLNIPYPVSYVPTGLLNMTTDMDFWQRMSNAWDYVLMGHIFIRQLYAGLDELIADLKLQPEVPSIAAMENKVSFVITNDHPSLGPRVPTMPYYVRLGGLHLKPTNEKLPQDLEDFMQSSGAHGVVYFSLGGFTRGKTMPADMKRKLVEAFARVPYKVLWKYEEPVEDLTDNVKTMEWTPQQALLAHHKVRLFMTHGGALSFQEAAYHGCPLLGFPLNFDQNGNMATARSLGFSESLDWRTFTAEQLRQTIVRMVEDKRYKMNAMKVSDVFRDRIERPVDTAAYWIEYVIRHKGAAHLKSGAENLNIFQYFLLDIIGAIAAAVLLVSAASFWVFWKVLKYIVRKVGVHVGQKQKTH